MVILWPYKPADYLSAPGYLVRHPMGTLRLAPATVSDYRRLAESRLPRQLFDYIDGGAVDERTLTANREDLARLRLRQRVLRDVSQVDTTAQIAGRTAAMP